MDLQPLESGNAVLQTVQSSEGGRAFKLLQERQRRLKGLEAAKTEIEKETQRRRLCHIDEKYTGSTSEALEAAFREETVGLVTAEEFRAKRLRLLQKLEDELAAAQVVATKPCATGDRIGSVKRHQVQKSKLSFVEAENDEDSEESEPLVQPVLQDKVKKAFKKDPTVDTSFLSDVEREEKLRAEKEKIIREYYEEQERIKREPLEITYSYWDGLGHRRTVQVQKGTTVGQFLSECRKSLEKDFPELRSVATDNLMYIKEDLILPHSVVRLGYVSADQRVTFYELIKNKARGKSGPLFKFDVHDDVRMYSDVRVEKDETHAGKIVERKWYERNKHIFPASRWEQYDPNRTYEKYTIHGDKDYSTTVV